MSHIENAVQQLRRVEGNEATAHDSVDLYRGLAGRCVPPEFLAKGGTELAPMSTTRILKVNPGKVIYPSEFCTEILHSWGILVITTQM